LLRVAYGMSNEIRIFKSSSALIIGIIYFGTLFKVTDISLLLCTSFDVKGRRYNITEISDTLNTHYIYLTDISGCTKVSILFFYLE